MFKLGTGFLLGALRADWQTNFDYSPWQLEHAEVVVRGWASRRGTSSRVVVDHPFMLERCGRIHPGCVQRREISRPPRNRGWIRFEGVTTKRQSTIQVADTVVAPEYLSLRRQNHSRLMTKAGRELGTTPTPGRNFDSTATFDNEDLEYGHTMDQSAATRLIGRNGRVAELNWRGWTSIERLQAIRFVL